MELTRAFGKNTRLVTEPILMKNWNLSTKLITIAFIGGVGSIVVVAWLSVSHGTTALLEQQTNALEAVRRSRQGYIENYFNIIREQVRNFARG